MGISNLGRIGIWSTELRFGDKHEIAEAAAELDELGFGALWVPGGVDDGVLKDMNDLLAVTQRAVIASGILNIWKHQPEGVAEWFRDLPTEHQQRVMLGLGVSHGPLIGEAWQKPLAATRDFLDGLEQAGMPRDNLCLAALGPKMLALSAQRTAGAHPYLVTPEHTARAREILGANRVLAPEQGVILEADPTRARKTAREALTHYAQLPNYRNNWLRLGFSQEDVDTVSDRLLDGLFAWGDIDTIASRAQAHLDAGANHVCLQVVRGPRGGDIPGLLGACRELARVLL